jgi:Protein of unknown function (DUF3365)
VRSQGAMLLAVGMAVTTLVWNVPAKAAGIEVEVAEHLIKLVKIGRVIVSEQMETINDASKAEKGFTGNHMAGQILERFKKVTKLDLRIPNVVPQANLYLSLVQAEKDVVDEVQPVINRAGIAFKGFIPAVFAKRVGDQFYEKSGIRLKLTAIDYRNTNNKPDDFEAEVLRMFSDSRHPKGQPYVRSTMVDGQPVLRMMDPEYVGQTCLACHGVPRGALTVGGMKKDGWKDGDLAGAISIVLPLK